MITKARTAIPLLTSLISRKKATLQIQQSKQMLNLAHSGALPANMALTSVTGWTEILLFAPATAKI